MENNNRNNWKTFGSIFAWSTPVPLIIGFYKLSCYENGEYYFSEHINTYVGGDAYNYIINANYATGYFVLATFLLLAAIGCGLMWNLYEIRKKLSVTNEDPIEDIVAANTDI